MEIIVPVPHKESGLDGSIGQFSFELPDHGFGQAMFG